MYILMCWYIAEIIDVLLCHDSVCLQADPGNNWEDALKSLMIRVEGLEEMNALFKLQNEHLTHANDVLNYRLFHVTRANAALEQRVEQLEADNCRQQAAALKPSSEPDTRSQFTAFACTLSNMIMACPSNRTILTTSGVYGLFDSPNSDCSGCCAPNPEYDCTELVEENRVSDWLAIQALCDGEASCQFESPGNVLGGCSGQTSDYMQLFYDCLPDEETGPVAFTAWADTGEPTYYTQEEIIVFDQILTNAGGHYNVDTSSFVCPYEGLYLVSAHVQSYYVAPNRITADLMYNKDMLVRMSISHTDNSSHRTSTTIVTECARGDILWVKFTSDGTRALHCSSGRTVFTGYMLHRYQ